MSPGRGSSSGIAEWPELAKGLFCIGAGETVLQTMDRIVAMSADDRARIAATARSAACGLNDWNLDTWIQRLQPEQGGRADGGAA